jgi:protein-S-isoprenylcysteine O-methyltransferase Ste14
MRTTAAAGGSTVFLVIVPGTVTGLAPWWLTRWQAGAPYPLLVRAGGVILLAVGAAVLLHAFARFVSEGTGTPAPAAPTQRLVTGGLYRYVRNPMYLAVLAVIAGQALLLSRPVLLAYAAAVGAAVGAFARWYEEPTLARQYGAQYQAYRRQVPAWCPRRPPLRKGGGDDPPGPPSHEPGRGHHPRGPFAGERP